MGEFGLLEQIRAATTPDLENNIKETEIIQRSLQGRFVAQEQTSPKVAILLCTYHGQHFLADQLDSFAAQTHNNWDVWASDDGSTDDTRAILEGYRSKWTEARLSIHCGPEEGFVANFLSLICKASSSADYYAYSDQDDIWEATKLERALAWLQSIPKNVPALYCSRTRLVDTNDNDIGFSPLFTKPPSFANALVQNVGGGNTMVFNKAARQLLCQAGENVDVPSHDWWAYLLISGCGGQVHYDPYPSLRYRQHSGNLVGCNNTWPARFQRICMIWQGRFRIWNDRNIAVLQSMRGWLTADNQKTLDLFAAARNRPLLHRLLGLKQAGLYRQTALGTLGLIVAAVFRKI